MSLTDQQLDALAERYAVRQPGSCPVCGGQMVATEAHDRMGKYWNCASLTPITALLPLNPSPAEIEAARHRSLSVTFVPNGDPEVLALVAEVRRLRGQLSGDRP